MPYYELYECDGENESLLYNSSNLQALEELQQQRIYKYYYTYYIKRLGWFGMKKKTIWCSEYDAVQEPRHVKQ